MKMKFSLNLKINRIYLFTAALLAFLSFYELRIKPQSRPLYERALAYYRNRDYEKSLTELERAYRIEPNSTAILMLRGWCHLKLRQFDQAQENFGRASRLEPDLAEPKLGLAYVVLETGQGEAPVAGMQALLSQQPGNSDFRLAAAAAFRESGRNLEAADAFRILMNSGKYGEVARKNLLDLYGLEGLEEPIPDGLPTRERPAQLQLQFRASGSVLQHLTNGAWKPFYVKGVNLDVAGPGAFPSEPPGRTDKYLETLGRISQMGANTIRVYRLLPPAFYRALKTHNEKSGLPRLYLLQQIGLIGQDAANLFDSATIEPARAEIRYAIDALHGQGNVPPLNGSASGLYTVDVSEYVLGLALGRALEPHLALATNQFNTFRNSYTGKFASIKSANATEVWLTTVLDFAASYETEKYNTQHAIGIVSWAGLDPLAHPTEASAYEELAIERSKGERPIPPAPNEIIDDDDAVSIDEAKIQVGSPFLAGIFSAMGVSAYYPDFVSREYAGAQDRQGPNPFFGYLKALKDHYRGMPLVAVEYGMSTSLGISRLQPSGWNHGGLTEKEHADLVARMTRNVSDAGFAGGFVTTWQDEWYKANWLTGPLDLPTHRRALWNNKLDPDQSSGLWTYDPPGQSGLFAGFSGWNSVKPQYAKSGAPAAALKDGWDTERTLRSLSVTSDEAYVYLRLQVDNIRKGPKDVPDLYGANYFVALNTSPGRFGTQALPALLPQVRSDQGANFLLYLSSAGARLMVATNYNPRHNRLLAGTANVYQIGFKIPFEPKLEKWSGFEDIEVETNRRRFARDGRMFPSQRQNLSTLHYRPPGDTEDTVATWTCDFAGRAFVFRLPWSLLLVTDPSSLQVLSAAARGPLFATAATKGIQVFALSFHPGEPIQFQVPFGRIPIADSLPGSDDRGNMKGLATYSWAGWNSVTVTGRPKAAYASLQKVFKEMKGPS